MIPLLGFAPDLPTTTEGILLDCSAMIPSETGMKAAPSQVAYSDALAAECLGAEVLTKLDGSRRVFAGTAAKLYELSGTSWTDVARVGDYTLGATSHWSFAQFGDTSFAATIDAVIQSSSSGDFANQATAPQATLIESVMTSGGGFLMACNTIDGTYGTRPDAWWCSALNDPTSWTPSVTTQATTGRLLGTEGPITALRKFGADRIVAYKARAMYLGGYAGPPYAFQWQEYPGLGCVGMNAVANLGTAHFVVGEDTIYIFDGSLPRPVDEKIRQWFLANSSGTYRYRTTVVYDREKDHVWIFYPGVGSTTLDKCIVYHVKSGRWGRHDMSVETALLFNTPSVTFDGDSGAFDDATETFDQSSPGNLQMAVFSSSHVLATLSGVPDYATMTLFDIGNDTTVTRLTETRLRYEVKPSDIATCIPYGSMALDNGLTVGDASDAYETLSTGKNTFPLRQTSRWHRLYFYFAGNVDITGVEVKVKPVGSR